jgi:hypothetical protein
MGHERKRALLELLVKVGFEQIELGFPSASQTDFDFIRWALTSGVLPAKVIPQVITQARQPLIARTFESLRGAKRAILHPNPDPHILEVNIEARLADIELVPGQSNDHLDLRRRPARTPLRSAQVRSMRIVLNCGTQSRKSSRSFGSEEALQRGINALQRHRGQAAMAEGKLASVEQVEDGGTSCGANQYCCGPAACGFCAIDGTGPFCGFDCGDSGGSG